MLLVVVTVLCVWLGFKVNAARRQKEALAIIRKFVGTVVFEDEMVPMPGSPERLIPAFFAGSNPPPPPGPVWLRKWLGDEYFRNVYHIGLVSGGGLITESELKCLITLPTLRSLNLIQPKNATDGSLMQRPLRDSDLVCLEGVHHLRELVLESPDITDAGMTHIRNLFSLEYLTLSEIGITDAGLRNLKGLVNLKHLAVTQSRITLIGIRELQKSLPNCKVTSVNRYA
jgi:hypothetical protein